MHKTRVILVILVVTLMLAGCRPPMPSSPSTPPPLTSSGATAGPVELEPEPLLVSGPVDSISPYQGDLLLSPNHDYLLASQDKGTVVLLPLSAGESPISLYSPEPTQDASHPSILWPLGWASSTTCLFIIDSYCSTDSHMPHATTTLYKGDVVSKTASSVASFTHTGTFDKAVRNRVTGKVFVHVSAAVWQMDPVEGSAKTIRADLPTWDGFFEAIPSPTGEHLAFQLPFDSHNAISLLETATGTERRIHDDEGYSYYPVWSPDGHYVAAFYSASDGSDLLPGILPGRVGPYPASKRVIVYDTRTQTSRIYAADGKWILWSLIWSGDSKTLQFGAGYVAYDPSDAPSEEPPDSAVDSVWSVDVSETGPAVKVGNLRVSDLAPEAFKRGVTQADSKSLLSFRLAAASPGGETSYVSVWDNGTSSVWRLENGKDPVKVTDAVVSPCMFAPACSGYRVLPVYGSKHEVWLLGPGADGKTERLLSTASGKTGDVRLDWIEVVACDGDMLVLAARLEDLAVGPVGMHSVLVVYEL